MKKQLLIVLSLFVLQITLGVVLAQTPNYYYWIWEPNETLRDFLVQYRYEFLVLSLSAIITVVLRASLNLAKGKGKLDWNVKDINRIAVALFLATFVFFYYTGYVAYLYSFVALFILIGMGSTIYAVSKGLPDPWSTYLNIVGLLVVAGFAAVTGQPYVIIFVIAFIIYVVGKKLMKGKFFGGGDGGDGDDVTGNAVPTCSACGEPLDDNNRCVNEECGNFNTQETNPLMRQLTIDPKTKPSTFEEAITGKYLKKPTDLIKHVKLVNDKALTYKATVIFVLRRIHERLEKLTNHIFGYRKQGTKVAKEALKELYAQFSFLEEGSLEKIYKDYFEKLSEKEFKKEVSKIYDKYVKEKLPKIIESKLNSKTLEGIKLTPAKEREVVNEVLLHVAKFVLDKPEEDIVAKYKELEGVYNAFLDDLKNFYLKKKGDVIDILNNYDKEIKELIGTTDWVEFLVKKFEQVADMNSEKLKSLLKKNKEQSVKDAGEFAKKFKKLYAEFKEVSKKEFKALKEAFPKKIDEETMVLLKETLYENHIDWGELVNVKLWRNKLNKALNNILPNALKPHLKRWARKALTKGGNEYLSTINKMVNDVSEDIMLFNTLLGPEGAVPKARKIQIKELGGHVVLSGVLESGTAPAYSDKKFADWILERAIRCNKDQIEESCKKIIRVLLAQEGFAEKMLEKFEASYKFERGNEASINQRAEAMLESD